MEAKDRVGSPGMGGGEDGFSTKDRIRPSSARLTRLGRQERRSGGSARVRREPATDGLDRLGGLRNQRQPVALDLHVKAGRGPRDLTGHGFGGSVALSTDEMFHNQGNDGGI